MQLESPLPYLKDPETGPFAESAKFSPHSSILFLFKVHLNFIFPSMPSSLKWSLPLQDFRLKSFTHLSSLP
jgi:hypothetical protein